MAKARDLEAEFKSSVRGHARAAKAAGQHYFQALLFVTYPYQVWSDRIRVDRDRIIYQSDLGAVLTDVEEEGWKLFVLSVTYVTTSGSRPFIGAGGAMPDPSGSVVGLYVFEATPEAARVDRLWDRYG